MTRAKKFEATTYLRTDNLESIADLAHDLDVKAREYARGREGIAVIKVRPAPSISSVANLFGGLQHAPLGAPRPPGTSRTGAGPHGGSGQHLQERQSRARLRLTLTHARRPGEDP